MSQTYSAELRERAMVLFREHGARKASRLLAEQGTPVGASTIQAWASKAGIVAELSSAKRAKTEAARVAWADRRLQAADRAGDASDEFLEMMLLAGREGNDVMLRALSTAYGITTDKANLLSGGTTAREEHGQLSPVRLREATIAKLAVLRNGTA